MKFDTVQMLEDLNVSYIDRHGMLTSAYVGFEVCPLCGHSNSGRVYAAMRRDSNVFTCWNCKGTDFHQALQVLTGITDYHELKAIYKKYGHKDTSFTYSRKDSDIKRPTKITLPGSPEMIRPAEHYLKKREFNPIYLWEKYSLRSTRYDKPSYRIIIPVTFNKRVVSYTSRDYTDKQDLRVVSCKNDLEVIPHKHIFLGLDYVRGKNVVVVEGPFDQMRVGDGALCSFGSEVTLEQLILLAQRYDNVFFMPDGGEEKPLELMRQSAIVLQSVGVNAEIIELSETDDPDNIFKDMDELLYLRKELQLS